MTYGDSEDTAFYYKGFDDKLPKKKPYFVDETDKHDYSYWNLDAKYEELINRVTAFDKTCSVTPNNGNAYVIKVDSKKMHADGYKFFLSNNGVWLTDKILPEYFID